MNSSQKNYTIKRIESIRDCLKDAAKQKYSEDYNEFLKLLSSKMKQNKTKGTGELLYNYVLSKLDQGERSIYISDMLKELGIADITNLTKIVEKNRNATKEKLAEVLNKINKETTKITDEVMFGNEKEAIELLNKFENMVI